MQEQEKETVTATEEEIQEDLGLKELAEMGNQWIKLDKTIKEALEDIEEKKEGIRGNDGV